MVPGTMSQNRGHSHRASTAASSARAFFRASWSASFRASNSRRSRRRAGISSRRLHMPHTFCWVQVPQVSWPRSRQHLASSHSPGQAAPGPALQPGQFIASRWGQLPQSFPQ